jgi:hypothetical protein
MGTRRAGWRFKGKTPLWCQGLVGLLVADSMVHLGLLLTVSSWASATRDAEHSYRVPFRDGVNYFVQPWLGWYLDAWWIGVGLLVVLLVLLLVKREMLERGV